MGVFGREPCITGGAKLSGEKNCPAWIFLKSVNPKPAEDAAGASSVGVIGVTPLEPVVPKN